VAGDDMETKSISIPVVITREKMKNKDVYVAECPLFNVASQGKDTEEAIEHLKEALQSYWKSPYSKKVLPFEQEVVLAGSINMSLRS
jgi:predicted RNase H-like HicB family nuclease